MELRTTFQRANLTQSDAMLEPEFIVHPSSVPLTDGRRGGVPDSDVRVRQNTRPSADATSKPSISKPREAKDVVTSLLARAQKLRAELSSVPVESSVFAARVSRRAPRVSYLPVHGCPLTYAVSRER